MQQKSVYRLVESALLLAIAAVLSVIKIVDMPYGGSITAFSMLPLLIIAYRYGVKWGLVTAFTYSLIQLLLGLENFSYVAGALSLAALALFDYLLAFLALGLGGIFRRDGRSQTASLVAAAVFTGVLRYLCHCVSGFTVWRDLSVPFSQSLIYSFSYNATYMIPEIVILALGAVYISRVMSFDRANITRAAVKQSSSSLAFALSAVAKTALLVGAVWAVVLIAPALQSAETGALFLAGLAAVKWGIVGIVAAVSLVLFGVFTALSKKINK